MTIVLGIDPGSRVTGYGIVSSDNGNLTYIDSGCIRTTEKKIPGRLKQIYVCVSELIAQYQPDEAAIEEVFMHINPGGAIKLGQARGAAITALVRVDLEVYEYSARRVKQAVVGSGAADKIQVQHMVKTLLKLNKSPQEDAADALAIAICHINSKKSMDLIDNAKTYSRSRLK
jgi:crossover junction endodeoxyribonuclease RuvC